MDLPHIYVSETFYNALMAGLTTAVFFQIVTMAYLFWRLSRSIACETGPLPTLPIAWSGTKSTRRMYEKLCNIPSDIEPTELARRIRAFNDDFRAIPLTVTLHGIRFRLPFLDFGGQNQATLQPAAVMD